MPDSEVSLPTYMMCLDQETVDDLADFPEERVIACGVHPSDSSLVFVTNKLNVRSISPNGKLVPHAARPAPDGRSMRVSFVGFEGSSVIDVKHAIARGDLCTSGGSLYVNDRYVCNVDMSSDTYEKQ